MSDEAKGPICPICKVRPIQKHRSSCDDRICGLINRHQVQYETMTPSLNLLVRERERGNELLAEILGVMSVGLVSVGSSTRHPDVLDVVINELSWRSDTAKGSGESHSHARSVALRSACKYVMELKASLLEKGPRNEERGQSPAKAALRPWRQEWAALDAEIEAPRRELPPPNVWAPPHEDDDDEQPDDDPRSSIEELRREGNRETVQDFAQRNRAMMETRRPQDCEMCGEEMRPHAWAWNGKWVCEACLIALRSSKQRRGEDDAEPEPRTLPGERICIHCDASMESEPVRVGELLICAECRGNEAGEAKLLGEIVEIAKPYMPPCPRCSKSMLRRQVGDRYELICAECEQSEEASDA